ncbi:hypothetical protein PtB15_4B822 [Puccinia triticina]|nr:hypothetical protein PtB15_4B822 [Puccinia triticina]
MSCAAARLPVGCFSAICRVTQAVRRKASKSRSHSINDSRQQSAHRTRRCEHPGPTHQGSEFQQEIKKYLEYAQEQIVPSEELLRLHRKSENLTDASKRSLVTSNPTTSTTTSTPAQNASSIPTSGFSQPQAEPQLSTDEEEETDPPSPNILDPAFFELYKLDEKVKDESLKAVSDALILDTDALICDSNARQILLTSLSRYSARQEKNLEIANSLKNKLTAATRESNTGGVKECLEQIKKKIIPSEDLIRDTKIEIAVRKKRNSVNPEIAKLAKSIIRQWKSHMKKKTAGSQSSSAPKNNTPAATLVSEWSTDKGNGTGPRSSKTEGLSLNFELYGEDQARNGSLTAVFDALIFDSDAPADLIYERAKAIESEVSKSHDSIGYKDKMWSLVFDLRDPNNPGIRKSVLLGEISAGRLCVMGPQDMARERMKAQDRKLAEENTFAASGAEFQHAQKHAFRCTRCGHRECAYYQMQTAVADEPLAVESPLDTLQTNRPFERLTLCKNKSMVLIDPPATPKPPRKPSNHSPPRANKPQAAGSEPTHPPAAGPSNCSATAAVAAEESASPVVDSAALAVLDASDEQIQRASADPEGEVFSLALPPAGSEPTHPLAAGPSTCSTTAAVAAEESASPAIDSATLAVLGASDEQIQRASAEAEGEVLSLALPPAALAGLEDIGEHLPLSDIEG